MNNNLASLSPITLVRLQELTELHYQILQYLQSPAYYGKVDRLPNYYDTDTFMVTGADSDYIQWSVMSLGQIVNGELPIFILELELEELKLYLLEKLKKGYEDRLEQAKNTKVFIDEDVLLSDLETVTLLIAETKEILQIS